MPKTKNPPPRTDRTVAGLQKLRNPVHSLHPLSLAIRWALYQEHGWLSREW